jgi:hypothetical protein
LRRFGSNLRNFDDTAIGPIVLRRELVLATQLRPVGVDFRIVAGKA